MSDITVTEESINALIVKEEFMRIGKKSTICLLTLSNGYEVDGYSACVDPRNFNEELGNKYSKEDAVKKIWALEGYRLQCQNPVT